MSRFKLFGILQAMMAGIMGDTTKSAGAKSREVATLNRKNGGMLFNASPYGPKQLNQRQKRKRWAQNR